MSAAVAAPAPATSKTSLFESAKAALQSSKQALSTKGHDAYQVAQPYLTAVRPYAPVVVGAIAVGAITGLVLAHRRP